MPCIVKNLSLIGRFFYHSNWARKLMACHPIGSDIFYLIVFPMASARKGGAMCASSATRWKEYWPMTVPNSASNGLLLCCCWPVRYVPFLGSFFHEVDVRVLTPYANHSDGITLFVPDSDNSVLKESETYGLGKHHPHGASFPYTSECCSYRQSGHGLSKRFCLDKVINVCLVVR